MKRKETTFKTVQVKGGKDYVEVKDRVKYLAFDFEGDYSITTDYQYFESRKMWVVKATVTLIKDGVTSTYTGLAQEIESEKFGTVNFTSALENAETSAVGRACAFAGIGIETSIASADEVNKAINRAESKQPTKPLSKSVTPAPVQAEDDPKAAELKALIDTASQIDSLDKFNQFAAQHRVWQGVEGFDMAMEEVYNRVKDLPKPITHKQKTDLLLLLNTECITKEEKDKMVAKLSTLDTVRADQAIAKVKKTIQERQQPNQTAA